MNDALGGIQTALVLGGTSELALATLAALDLRPGARVVLAGRDEQAMGGIAVPTSSGGKAEVSTLAWDALHASSGPALIAAAAERLGDIDLVLVAAGILGEQARAETDVEHAVDILCTNLVGVAAAVLPAAERLRAQGHGTIIVFSSVAGLRGRRANYVYGASKAGLDALAEGVQSSLAGSGAHLLVVRPGFVRGKMTDGMESAPFATTPEAVGAAVADAVRKGREAVHVPRLLGPVFAGFRLLPRPVFRRLPG
jgi:decaprenylphospho-beta-D-erythro-pentofuranosid-2-ulose 2-reductase